jgi:hypothetical protein
MSLRSSPLAGARAPGLAAMALVLVCCWSAQPVPAPAEILIPTAHDDITVLLADGWQLAGVTVRWSEPDAALAVHRAGDGARRLYQPGRIRALRDAAGRDVTAEILPRWVLPHLAGDAAPRDTAPAGRSGDAPGTTPASGFAEVGQAAAGPPGHPWGFLFGFAAGYSTPLDDDLAGFEGDLGFDASARLRLLGSLYLAGGYAWRTLGPPDEHESAGEDPQIAVPDARITGYWAGLSLVPAGRRPATTRVYAEGGVGRYEVDHMPVQTGDRAFLGYTGGVGLLIPVGDAAVVDVGGRALHLVNLDLGGATDRHTTLGLRVGVNVLAR